MHALLFAFLVCTRECCSFWFFVCLFLLSKWFFNRLWGWTKKRRKNFVDTINIAFFSSFFLHGSLHEYIVLCGKSGYGRKNGHFIVYYLCDVWINVVWFCILVGYASFFSSFLCSPFCSDTHHWWYLWYLLLLTMSFHYIRIFCFDLYTVAILAHMKSTTICNRLKSEKYLFC